MVEPRMAIACRDRVEIDVALRMIEKAGIEWSTGRKATNPNEMEDINECRLYIYPPDSFSNKAYLLYDENPDDFEYDEDDDIEWIYLEASELFKNQIISERRKYCTAT